MKRRLNIIIQATVILFCGLNTLCLPAQQRSMEEIKKIARSIQKNQLIGIELKIVSSDIIPEIERCNEKEAFYIFSQPEKNNGFIIVSGDKRMPAILAYSEDSSFDTDSIPPNVRYWLDCYTEAFLSLQYMQESHEIPFTTENDEIASLLGKNTWGQGDPFNRLCPSFNKEKCLTGCVATAMAQVMRYHQYPIKGTGVIDYPTHTNGIPVKRDVSIEYQWKDMLDDYNGSFTSKQADAVADLMYSCGASVRMDYCTARQGGSGAYQEDLITAFVENFGYDKDAAFVVRSNCSLNEWNMLLTHELNEGRPVNYAGQSPRDGGHSFVIDGYQMSKENKYPNYHVNWGWNGRCDGYYQIVDLQPSENGQDATMVGFNDSQQMTIGIMPENEIDDSRIIMCSSLLRLSSNNTNVSKDIQVSTVSCMNLSYKPFIGTLHVMLISEENDTTICGEFKTKSLNYLQKISNISIEVTLPPDLPEGTYTVRLCSSPINSKCHYPVFAKEYPQLIISNGGKIIPQEMGKVNLGCSDIEVVKQADDDTLICLNIYEMLNIEERPFIGDIRMILANSEGKQICAFGDSILLDEMGSYEIVTKPLVLRGSLTGNWQNGNYRLYVGARHISESEYTYVSFYDHVLPDEPREYYLETQIKNGKIIIKDMTYNIIPTSIHLPNNSSISKFYSVFGLRVNQIENGIYILKKSDGTSKKLLVR